MLWKLKTEWKCAPSAISALRLFGKWTQKTHPSAKVVYGIIARDALPKWNQNSGGQVNGPEPYSRGKYPPRRYC